MDWIKIGKNVLVVDLVLVNAGVGYVLFYGQNSKPKTQPNADLPNTYTFLEMDDKLARLKQEILAETIPTGKPLTLKPSISPRPTIQTKQTPQTKIRSVSYVTIPGSGRSTTFDWGNLAGTEFYFDKSDYPGLIEAYFEASISLFNGNGKAYVRLFDTTHGIGVQGSEVETESQATTVVESGKLSFWAGKNLYRIQAKTLTSDMAVFGYGRIRIVTEN